MKTMFKHQKDKLIITHLYQFLWFLKIHALREIFNSYLCLGRGQAVFATH